MSSSWGAFLKITLIQIFHLFSTLIEIYAYFVLVFLQILV